MGVPSAADRWRFWGLFVYSSFAGWAACVLWMLSAYSAIQVWIQGNLSWVLGWVGNYAPRHQIAPEMPESIRWFIWGLGPEWVEGSEAPSGAWQILVAASHMAWKPLWLPDPGYRTGMVLEAHSVWWALALWHIGVVFAVRTIWDRRSQVRRSDAWHGHLFCVGRIEWWTGTLSGALSAPLLGLWRLERGLWEAAILRNPAGRWTALEMVSGAQWVMVAQIALVHWLIVWYAYRWSMRRGIRRGEVVMRAWDRCPWCGYETAADRCPECGADRGDPRSIRPRVVIPWIERRPWLRWVFRTPTAIGAIVFLFFSPVWVPAVRMAWSAVFP